MVTIKDIYETLKKMELDKYKELLIELCGRCAKDAVEHGYIPADTFKACVACYVALRSSIIGGLEELCKKGLVECDDVINRELENLESVIRRYGLTPDEMLKIIEITAEEL